MNHILILIFAIVGVSLWGISEFLLVAEEESRENAAESASVVTETKRILIDRAIRPPPRAVADVSDCGLQAEEGCYNYYNDNQSAYIKHAPFTLPCPDLATDGNLDGASDPGPFGCSTQNAGALQSSAEMIRGKEITLNHRLGRIPWRDERADGLFARGLGNRDLRDGAAARLWYGVARNIAPCVVQNKRDDLCPFHSEPDAARNAAALLTMTSGWLSVITQDDDGNQIVLSDRVAAVVISPGAPNGEQSRPDEDALYAGIGADSAALPALAVAQNYLEGENADGDDVFFAYGQYGISLQIGDRADVNANPNRRSEDHLEYITIDELAAAFAQGEQTPDYEKDIAELLEGYYNRVGHYPDPAVFHRASGEGKSRPPGAPRTSPEILAGEQVLIRGATGADNVLTVALRVADLPPVYLAPGWRFPDRAGNFDNETTFPFNESLAKMNTRFSDSPLEGLAGANNYEALYENAAHAVETEDIYGLSALEMETDAATEAGAPVFNFVARAPELLAAPGENLRVILAAPMAVHSTAAVVAQFPDDDSAPPNGADIVLPAGTELEIAVGDETYAQFPSGLQIRGRRYRATLAAEPLTADALGALYPELDIPVRVRSAIISFVDVNSPAGELTFDQNGQLGGVGPQNGWMRGRTPDGIISRYEFRPVFSLLGGIANLSFDDTGYLSEADRMANNTVGHSAHAIVLSSIQIRDPGDYPGVGVRPRHLRATMQIVNPQAWHFGGSSHDNVTPRDLDHLGPSGINDHLSDYYLLGPQFPNARRRLMGGAGNFSGRPIQINFQRVPFSQVLIHSNPGGGQLAAPQCEPTHCPYSIGFFADEIIIGVVPNNAAINAELKAGETSGVELTEQTLLPARLVDKSGAAVVSLIRAAPSASEAVAGRMGFVPATRAAAAMDSRFYNLATVARLDSFNGNAAARLYFPLTMASRFNRELIPFPPPGRPALRGAFPNGPDSELESNLRPLPHPLSIPSGAAVGMPVGAQIVIPTITTALPLGRGFTFPNGAVALLPPGAEVAASVLAGHVLPNGMQVPAMNAGTRIVSLPHGGVLPLEGSRFLAGGGKYDEMLELEIRGAAVGMNSDGQVVNLGDGSVVQPFTGRALSPNRIRIEDGAELSGASRIRGKFLSRPQTAPRTGEPEEPGYPLKLGSAEAASQSFAAGSFNFENHDAAGALNLAFDEDTEFTLPPDRALTVDIGVWPNVLNPLPLAALRFFIFATSPQVTPGATDRIIYGALEEGMRAWVAQNAGYYASVAPHISTPGFAANVRALAAGIGANPCEHLAPDRSRFVLPGGEREWIDCIFRQTPQNPRTPALLSFGAAELDAAGNYYLANEGTRQESALTLTLPTGTRIYDKRFQGGRALIAAAGTQLPLAADLGGPDPLVFNNGLARFHFALFPENDIVMRAPGGDEMVVPAGAVADLGGRVIHPPAGVMRLPRVAGDLELVSNGAMMIYIGGDDSAIEYEYAEVLRRDDPPTPERARFAIPILNPADPPSHSEARGMLTETAPSPRNELMEVPEGAIIVVPPGDPLPLHAGYMLTSNTAQSHLRLPQNSAMVLRAGLTAYMSGGASIAGPAYVRLGGTAENGRAVAANLLLNHANIQTAGRSFVALTEPARMRPRPGARLDSPKTGIPAQARLDLFGNMEARADAWFFDEMLPARAAETLRNHPMAYAVAPECRRASAEAEKCEGENFEGLTFDIPPGEEIALPEDIVAPERFRIEAGDGSDFRATLFYRDAPDVAVKGAAVAYLRADENGRLGANASGPSGFSVADLSEEDNRRGRKFVVVYPPHSGLRVYLGLGAPPADATALADERDGANYVEVRQALTIHSGGYVGDGYETNTDNIAQAELSPGSAFALGAGSRPFDGGFRPGAFGKMSAATVRLGAAGVMAQVDLADYVAVNNGWRPEHFFNYNVSLGAQMTRVNSLGLIESHYRAGDNLDAGPGAADAFVRARAYEVSETGALDSLQLMRGQTLEMEPGYLWQGFIPAGGADLRFTRNDDLWRAYWPPSPESPEEALMQSRMYLRVHPADLALNFFGAGVETVEGLDGDAAQTPARELLAMNEALFQDFAASDYAPPNLSERRLMGYRMTVRDSETELLAPYYENPVGAEERPYYVHLNTPGDSGDFSHGVNPDILHIPPALRHGLVAQHALRINADGSYAPAGTTGDAEAFTYNAADPLLFTNWIPFSGVPPLPPSFIVGPFAGEAWRRFTNLPGNGLKVRRVRLGMDPLAARLAARRPSGFASDDYLFPVLRDPAAERGGGQSRFEKVSDVQTALDGQAKSLRLNGDPPRAGVAEATSARNLVGTLCDPVDNLQIRFGQPAVPPPPFNATVAALHPNYPAANYDAGSVNCVGGGNDRDTLPSCVQNPPGDSGGGLLPCAPVGRGDHSAGYDALFALRISTDAAGAPLAEPFFLNPPVLAVVRETGTGRAVTVTTHWNNFYGAQADGTPTLAARMVWGGGRAALPLGGADGARRRMAAAPANFQHVLPFQTGQIDSPEFLHDQDWDWHAFSGENVDAASLAPDELPANARALRGALLANAANTGNSDDERAASMALADAILARHNGDPNWRIPLQALGYDGTPTGGDDGAFATFAYFGNLLFSPFNASDRGEIYRVIAGIPVRVDKTNLHVGIFSGPFSHLAPDDPQNIAASGLDSSALNGMCGVEDDGDYLTVPFASPPIQLASMDSAPGLAWPRPGRAGGTFDLDKRIRGAFIPDANKAGLMHYLSPFQHERIVNGAPEFVSNPHENIRAQNRFQRGVDSGAMELIPGGGYRAVPAEGIPMNRARAKHTTDPAADSTTANTFVDIAAGEEKTTRVYSELYVYMDRPHNPEYMGGEKQKFVIGPGFRVEGAAAIVPPFAAARDRAAADIMAQRSKMMTDLFGVPPLGEIYAKQISGGRCRGMDPCPAMWTRSDWAPVLAGVVAMDAVNMEITSVFPESDLMENIYFIQPQPQMAALLADGTTTTLYAGSVIYPYSGKVIPAEALGADAELGITDRSAVAALDVSPAVAPSPVRIFREKTHLSDAIENQPRPIPKRGEFHIRVEVLSETRPDGSAYIESDSCPAFIPIVPDPAGPQALPGVDSGAAAYDTGTLANRVVSIVADGGVPAERYPPQITLAQVRMQKGGGAPNHQGATLRYGFGGDIVSVDGVIVRDINGDAWRIYDNDDPNADDGVTVIVNNANPAANRIQIDFGKTPASVGMEPFNIVGTPNLDPVPLAPNPPRALVYLQAGMNPDFCDGLVPPGTYDKSVVVRNDSPQDFQLQTDSYPPGFVARIPPRGHSPDYISAAITISRDLGLTEVPYQYSHETDGVLGFNSETYAIAAARGPVPSTLRASEPLFAQLRAACPGCVFTEHDPMSGEPLQISVPISATLHLPGRSEAELYQSYDFAVQTPATVNILSQTFRSPLNAYKSSNNPALSGNLVNAFFSPTNADCLAVNLNPELGCRFLEGGIVQRQATAGGEQIVYLLEYNAPPDVHGFRVEELQVVEPRVLPRAPPESLRAPVFVTDTTPNVAPPPDSSPAGAVAAFYITVSVISSPVRYEAPLLRDGLDDDGAFMVRETHAFVFNGADINPDANPPENGIVLFDLLWDVRRFVSTSDAARSNALLAMENAYLARRNGDADWYDALDDIGYGRGMRTGNDDAWNDFATASDNAGFATFDRDDPNELYRVLSSIPVRSFINTQSHGLAVLVRISGEDFVRSVSGRWSGGLAEITVILEPVDRDGILTIPNQIAPGGGVLRFAAHPTQLHGTQAEVLASRERVVITLSRFVELPTTTPRGVLGTATIVVNNPPLNVGVDFVSDDRHYHLVRESYTANEAAAVGGGVSEFDLLRRRETPLPSALGAAATLFSAGGERHARWHSSILGAEFHFAPVRAGVNGTLFADFPPEAQAFWDELEERRVSDEDSAHLHAAMQRVLETQVNGGNTAREIESLLRRGSDERRLILFAGIAAANAAGISDGSGAPNLLERMIAIYSGIPVGGVCVVEPLGFLPLYETEYDRPDGSRFGGAVVTSRVAPIARLRWDASDSEERGYYPGRFEVLGGNVNEVRRYDGGFARGFLATPHVAEALAAYYGGRDGWRGATMLASGRRFVEDSHVFSGIFSPYRPAIGTLNLTPRDDRWFQLWSVPINLSASVPKANEHIRLRNPLSYMWQSRRADAVHSEILGVRRLHTARSHELTRQNVCADPGTGAPQRENIYPNFCLNNQGADGTWEDSPYDFLGRGLDNYSRRFGAFAPATALMMMLNPDESFYAPRVRAPYIPTGVRLRSGAERDGRRPIRALRLPHAIETPQGRLAMPGRPRGYPDSAGKFFEFPPGARALVMNVDMSSWESVHPGMAATRGGMTYRHRGATVAARGTIGAAPAGAPGEAFDEFDVGGRKFLHYHRGESAPAEEPTSARRIYANAWVKLSAPGVLRSGGRRTRLREGTVLNPIEGTYVRAPRGEFRGNRDAVLPYASDAVAGSGAPLRLARAALVLPQGAKLVVRRGGVKMRKVRAAVFFSPAPLRRAECPASARPVDQLERRGALDDGTLFTLGHPCAWLDTPENMDGDREFIYTSRPRWNETRTRILTNDRVAVMGGELEF